MRDIHIPRSPPVAIPIISPALHCVAMTALVFLRSSFGYAFLRPRSIFFAFSWAVACLIYMAWYEPGAWTKYGTICIFMAAAVCLYWFHLAVSIRREITRSSDQDNYSGTSHLLRLFSASEDLRARLEMHLHLGGEPLVVFAAAAALRFFDETHLSKWLIVVGCCMVPKELMNYWSAIRRENLASRNREEVEEQSAMLDGKNRGEDVPRASRKEAVTRKRVRAEGEANE